eukprot:TRINITY_DN34800_c0_g1_i1.p1 TRINITY_DN34800_c0_g1~~TRINITY_DN34800_c0_g1_i1.p1  ORF type:complete len:1040 (+),score=221.97 TRINITY_DN34800_c0_g1_i1:68-3187(+)
MADEDLLQLDVFYWTRREDAFKTKHEQANHHKRMTLDELVSRFGVPRREVVHYVQKQMNETQAMTSLPFTLLFVAAYAAMVIVHDSAVEIRAVEDSIERDIVDNANFGYDSPIVGHENVYDVHSVTEFWSWMSLGFVPLLFQQERVFAEGRNMSDPRINAARHAFSVEERGTYLNYNRIMGGVRLLQERSKEAPCSHSQDLARFFNRSCLGKSYEIEPETWDALGVRNPEREVWLFVTEDFEVLQRRLLVMEASGWLDRATKKVEIGIPIFSGEFGMHSWITVNFYFSRGGHIWKQIIPNSAFVEWYAKVYYVVFDAIWVLCLCQILRTEIKEIRLIVKSSGLKGIYKEYIGVWSVLDLVSVIGGFLLCALCIVCMVSTDKCNQAIQEVPKVRDVAEGRNMFDPQINAASHTFSVEAGSETFARKTELYVEALERSVYHVYRFKLVLSAYPLIIVLRLFKAFSVQPRLAVVTKTIVHAGVDLAHFLCVLAGIFFTLALSGLVLFGRRLSSFTTFSRAVNTVFRLMLGDFDWEAIRKVGQAEGATWLFVSLTITNLLLLNMVLAIVLDSYMVVKTTSMSSDSLLVELHQIWTRWWGVQRGQQVPLSTIHKALVDLGHELDKKLKFVKTSRQHESSGSSKESLLLGLDTVAVPGMRVMPADEEIARVVGPGTVQDVAHLVCRVLHEDGQSREYNIGNYVNYELLYVDGLVKPAPLEEEDRKLQQWQALSTERLMKVVYTSSGLRMMYHQAFTLLKDVVMDFYRDHAEVVDVEAVRYNLRKAHFRMLKVQHVFQAGGGGQSMCVDAAKEVSLLREYLKEFFAAVDEDRKQIQAKIQTAKAEVVDLHKLLLAAQPAAMQDDVSEQLAKEIQNLRELLAGEVLGDGGDNIRSSKSVSASSTSSLAPHSERQGSAETATKTKAQEARAHEARRVREGAARTKTTNKPVRPGREPGGSPEFDASVESSSRRRPYELRPQRLGRHGVDMEDDDISINDTGSEVEMSVDEDDELLFEVDQLLETCRAVRFGPASFQVHPGNDLADVTI